MVDTALAQHQQQQALLLEPTPDLVGQESWVVHNGEKKTIGRKVECDIVVNGEPVGSSGYGDSCSGVRHYSVGSALHSRVVYTVHSGAARGRHCHQRECIRLCVFSYSSTGCRLRTSRRMVPLSTVRKWVKGRPGTPRSEMLSV